MFGAERVEQVLFWLIATVQNLSPYILVRRLLATDQQIHPRLTSLVCRAGGVRACVFVTMLRAADGG